MLQPEITGLLVLAVCVVLFLTKWIPAAATGILGCLLMVLLDVSSFEQVFSGFSNSIVLLMASAMVVGIAMFKTGAAQLLGRLAIRLAKGSERRFLLLNCTLTGILAMFLANTALIAAFLPIIDSVCRISPQMKRRNHVLPIALAAMFGGASTLIGTTPQLTANAILSKMGGMEMGMWELTGPGLSTLALSLIFLYFVGFRDGIRIWGGREEVELCTDSDSKAFREMTFDKKKLFLMLVIVVLMTLSYVFGFLPTAMTAMVAAMLCLLAGLCSTEDIVRQLHWESVIFLAACLGLANALTDSGAGDLIGRAVIGTLGEMNSPLVSYVVLVLLTLLISQFITNSTAIIIVLPIALSMCETYGYNPMAFTVGITQAASYAALTPLAASQIAMTEVAGYDFADYYKYGWKLTLVACLSIILLTPRFFPLQLPL